MAGRCEVSGLSPSRAGSLVGAIFALLAVAAATAFDGLCPAYGFVANTNGDYFVSFTDLELPKDMRGVPWRVGRIYNSRAQFLGMFGYGWSNDLDTFLIPSADGSIIIAEGGGGGEARFSAPGLDVQDLEFLVGRIVDAKAERAHPRDQFDRREYKRRLMSDAYFRDDEARDLEQTWQLPTGTVLYSSSYGKQQTTVLATGFVRDKGDGTKEFFEAKSSAFDRGIDSAVMRKLNGIYKMTRSENAYAKREITLTYDLDSGTPLKVTTADGKFIQFEYGVLGVVTKVTSSSGASAFYQYCESEHYNKEKRCQRADLVLTKDAAGHVYKYAYDDLHNLVEILNPDGTKEAIEYWGPEAGAKTGTVRSVRSANGVLTSYDYWVDPVSPRLHYRTITLTTYSSGTTFRTAYEYWDRRRNDGTTYHTRSVTRVADEETETLYNECCGRPEKITKNGETTEYDYDTETGLLKEKRTADDTTQWSYSNTLRGKITKVVSTEKASGRVLSVVNYQYDGNGQLVVASSLQHRVEIAYDSDGRITSVGDEAHEKMLFTYDNDTKPRRISLEGGGGIVITYDADGNIKDVEPEQPSSQQGRAVAVKVAAMFQTLLDMVKPAEISVP
jgi:YD repeat-containing protein